MAAVAEQTTTSESWRWVARGGLLIGGYVALDWLSYIHAFSPLGITPWSPALGFAFALVLRHGLGVVPAMAIAVLLAEVTVRGMPTGLGVAASSGVLVALCYGVAAMVLRRRAGGEVVVDRLEDVAWILLATVTAALCAALSVVGLSAALGVVVDLPAAVARYWIGDAIGIVVLTPFLLVHRDAGFLRRLFRSEYGLLEALLQIASVMGALWIFFGLDLTLDLADESTRFYPLFLPMVWIAARHGIGGATAASLLIQVAMMLAFQAQGTETGAVVAFQVFLFALTTSGLLLGAVVSERESATRALSESEARLRALYASVPDGIVTIDETGRIETMNPAARELFALRSDDPPRSAGDLLPGVGTHSSIARAEIVARRSDGTTFPAEIAAGPIEDASGRRLSLVVRDVTQRNETERRLRENERALLHAARLSTAGEMASGIAHEVSQPIAAIVAYARTCEILMRGQAPRLDRIGEALARLGLEAKRAGEVLGRLREFLHRGELQLREANLAQVIGEAIEVTRHDAAARGVPIVFEGARGPVSVFADRVHIQQVVINLVRNSLDALVAAGTAVPRIVVRLDATAAGAEVAVIDNGPGPSPDISDQLFQPFATDKEGGMGLGLSIARNVVEAHGGQLWHDASHAEGTAFRFTIPAGEE